MDTLESEQTGSAFSGLMHALRRAAPFTTAALVLAMAYLGWEMASRRQLPRRPGAGTIRYQADETYGGTELKLIHFYASPAVLEEGDKAILCYGLNNAKAVRIEPGLGSVDPSMNRCMDVTPEQTTRYTLTAQGAEGKTVSASFVLEVKPDKEKLPRILSFARGRKQREGDRTIQTLCFDTRNGVEVKVEPRAFPPGPVMQGCFYTVPTATTIYRLTVTDARGRKAERSLTVEVP